MAFDIHDSQMRMEELEKKASHDILTEILNHTSAKEQILRRMEMAPDRDYILAIFDLEYFKTANDTYGHLFGDRVLKQFAENLQESIGENDIVARIGGDELLIFLNDDTESEKTIKRIFDGLCGVYEGVLFSVSMGVAKSFVVGHEYNALFHAADQALYSAKRAGRSRCLFYDDSMRGTLCTVFPDEKEI